VTPWPALITLWCVLALAFVVVWAVRRRTDPIETGASTAFIGGAMGLLLSLVLFFAMGHWSDASSAAQREASITLQLSSSMALLPERLSNPLQHDVVCVMKSVVDDEWPTMARGDRNGDPITQARIGRLYESLRDLRATGANAVPDYQVQQVQTLMLDRAGARDERLSAGLPQVAMPIWAVIFVGVFVLVILIGVEEKLRGRAAWIGVGAALAAVLTMLIGVTAVLDSPYGALVQVEPSAMQNSIDVILSGQPANSPVVAPCPPVGRS
jgi:hypothetical protein